MARPGGRHAVLQLERQAGALNPLTVVSYIVEPDTDEQLHHRSSNHRPNYRSYSLLTLAPSHDLDFTSGCCNKLQFGQLWYPHVTGDFEMLFTLRLLTVLSGLGLLVFGLGWWVHPGAAAEMLGATLLEGTGRTAQIGDTGAFFVGAGMMLSWGAIRRQPHVLLAGGLLVGLVVPGRVAAAIYHGGAWTPDEIVAECAITILALTTASLLQKQH